MYKGDSGGTQAGAASGATTRVSVSRASNVRLVTEPPGHGPPAGSRKDGDMRQGKGVVLIAVLLIAVLGVAGFLAAGCGNKKNGTTSTTAAGGNQIEQILGHAPTGLAKQISDKGVIVIANDKAYPPQSYVDKTTGKLVGFDVDVANEVGKRLGVEVKFENPNWNSIPSGLKVDRYDVSIGSMTITQKRFDQGLDFSNPYYYTQGQVMIK